MWLCTFASYSSFNHMSGLHSKQSSLIGMVPILPEGRVDTVRCQKSSTPHAQSQREWISQHVQHWMHKTWSYKDVILTSDPFNTPHWLSKGWALHYGWCKRGCNRSQRCSDGGALTESDQHFSHAPIVRQHSLLTHWLSFLAFKLCICFFH